MVQCKGTTKAGTQCRKAAAGGKYCNLHLSQKKSGKVARAAAKERREKVVPEESPPDTTTWKLAPEVTEMLVDQCASLVDVMSLHLTCRYLHQFVRYQWLPGHPQYLILRHPDTNLHEPGSSRKGDPMSGQYQYAGNTVHRTGYVMEIEGHKLLMPFRMPISEAIRVSLEPLIMVIETYKHFKIEVARIKRRSLKVDKDFSARRRDDVPQAVAKYIEEETSRAVSQEIMP